MPASGCSDLVNEERLALLLIMQASWKSSHSELCLVSRSTPSLDSEGKVRERLAFGQGLIHWPWAETGVVWRRSGPDSSWAVTLGNQGLGMNKARKGWRQGHVARSPKEYEWGG